MLILEEKIIKAIIQIMDRALKTNSAVSHSRYGLWTWRYHQQARRHKVAAVGKKWTAMSPRHFLLVMDSGTCGNSDCCHKCHNPYFH